MIKCRIYEYVWLGYIVCEILFLLYEDRYREKEMNKIALTRRRGKKVISSYIELAFVLVIRFFFAVSIRFLWHSQQADGWGWVLHTLWSFITSNSYLFPLIVPFMYQSVCVDAILLFYLALSIHQLHHSNYCYCACCCFAFFIVVIFSKQ